MPHRISKDFLVPSTATTPCLPSSAVTRESGLKDGYQGNDRLKTVEKMRAFAAVVALQFAIELIEFDNDDWFF